MSSSPIRLVGLIGTGIMGRGLAELCLGRGVPVVLLGRGDASVTAARDAILRALRLAARRKRVDGEHAGAAEERLTPATDPAALTACGLAIEAVVEAADVKAKVLGLAERHLSPRALLATNTSALPVGGLARDLERPERFLGLHFMNPAPLVSLVECIPHAGTDAEALEQAETFVTDTLAKETVRAPDRTGFVVNRLLLGLVNQAARLLAEGDIAPAEIDRALRLGCGHAMGPLATADAIGLDTVLRELRELEAAYGPAYAPAPLIERLVREGNLGRKSGRGLLQAGP